MFRKYCEQTKLNFSLNYDNRQNIIIGKFELSSSSAYNYGLYSKLIFYLNEADNYIMIVNDEKRYLEDIVDNGKIYYYINKIYSTDSDTLDGIKDTHHKLKFIYYNTSTKRYEKYNLIDEDDFMKYCNVFGIDIANPVVRIYLSKIKNTNNIKIISMVFILNILSFLNLKYLYIYDESCSSYDIDPRLIQYYTEVAEPKMTIAEIDKEITKELYEEVQLKLDQENKKVGV